MRNTIVANNASAIGSNCSGTIISEGFNLIFPGTGCNLDDDLHDQVNVDPVLGPLADNGGPTPTHALLARSGAIDRGNPVGPPNGTDGRCAATDQRGAARPKDGDGNGTALCDIGAYERQSITVDDETDDDDLNPGDGQCDSRVIGNECNLRAAIQEANATGGGFTIILPAGTYTLTRSGAADNTALNGDLDITSDISIVGAGAGTTRIQAHAATASNAIDRVFDVRGGGSLALTGVAVRNGKPADGGGGGGIRSATGSPVSLDQVVVSGNSAADGAGLDIQGPTTVTNSAIHGNTATVAAGGVRIGSSSAVTTLTNVTLSTNSAGTQGGGLALVAATTATLNNVTVTANTAQNSGGLFRSSGTMTLSNTIVANNTATINLNCSDGVASAGNNLVFPGSGCGMSEEAQDRLNSDPKLLSLTSNGGETPTHALAVGSDAVDHGHPSSPLTGLDGRCVATDQRGIGRPLDGDANGNATCDIGAFEAGVPADVSIVMDPAGTFTVGQNGVYTITVKNSNRGVATVGTITVADTLPSGLTFVSGTGSGWSCSALSATVQCTRTTPIAPGTNSAIALTVAVGPSAAPGFNTTVTVDVANDFFLADNTHSIGTVVTVPPCSVRPNVALQVTQTGVGTGPGLLRATLTANTTQGLTSNVLTKVKLLLAENAAIDGLDGQTNLTTGEVTLANVPSTSFIVRRISSATAPRRPFTVQLE